MKRRRVLFVDDEPEVLEGLQHRLHRQRNKWDMYFVSGGQEAMEFMKTEEVDVIVSDIRMPKMDGTALLKTVQELFPGVIRIALSGYSELDSSLRAVPVVHQFMAKPSDPGQLEDVIERACALQALIDNEDVRRIVGSVECLPPLPQLYVQLVEALADENVQKETVARILEQDMAVSAKLLQIVNSAFFRLSRTIASVEEAVIYLGFDTVQKLVLAVEVFNWETEQATVPGFSAEALQQHALLVAGISTEMMTDLRQKKDAFVAGLLHDIGKLVLVTELPDHLEAVLKSMREDGLSMHQAETRYCGATHAEIGGYLLGLWGLPHPIVQAVANHHDPARAEQQEFSILTAVHVANRLANELQGPLAGGGQGAMAELDLEYLDGIGMSATIDTWRELAKTQAAELSTTLSKPGELKQKSRQP